jgi:hypothetical protein
MNTEGSSHEIILENIPEIAWNDKNTNALSE